MTESLKALNAQISELLVQRPVILQMMRFAAIGAINTALDFAILNLITSWLNINAGIELGGLNFIGVVAAMIQGYIWNRAWTFTGNSGSVVQNALRLIMVGGLGFLVFLAIVIAAAIGVAPIFFLVLLIGFLIVEFGIWVIFDLNLRQDGHAGVQFVTFIGVSVVGLIINSVILTLASSWLAPTLSDTVNPETVKNISKFLAICVSLVWNFIGYKLIVFKK